jgi:ABC-type multidrug transport system fused ATPase/permease subunit
MGGIAGPASLASMLLSAASSIYGGYSQNSSYQFQAQQAEKASQYGYIKAQQTSSQMSTHLQEVLGNIQAVGASANEEGDSPTNAALQNFSEFQGDADRVQKTSNALAQSEEEAQAAKMYAQMGTNAILGGYLGGAGAIAGGFAGLSKSTSAGGSGGIGMM